MTKYAYQSGNFLTTPFNLPKQFIDKFFRRVTIDPITKCWIWNGAKNIDGYGYVIVFGYRVRIHRLMYAWLIKSLPKVGKNIPIIHHNCNNPSCCNPFHLDFILQKKHNLLSIKNFALTNSKKTHCINGHPYPPYITGKQRVCMICHRMAQRRYIIKLHNKFPI